MFLSAENRADIALFIGRSVLVATNKVYDGHWRAWGEFILAKTSIKDLYLRDLSEKDKSATVSLFLIHRHKAGLRGKAATAVTAGIRMQFLKAFESTEFLDAAAVDAVRNACGLNLTELRAKRDAGAADTVKLPLCEAVLVAMRTRLWTDRAWEGPELDGRMTYIGCMWAYDMAARISEYTRAERGASDHCVRLDDLTFIVEGGGKVETVAGSGLGKNASLLAGWSRVMECRVLSASAKGKVLVKPKVIGRRSPEESQFLDDLLEFVMRSGAHGRDELFSHIQADGKKVALRGKSIREELKKACALHGLPPSYFSSHSLRKGAVTHMRAAGAPEDDRRDRGNYAPGSQVMNSTYDYATGLGPLAANSLSGGWVPSLEHVRRLIPAKREHHQ